MRDRFYRGAAQNTLKNKRKLAEDIIHGVFLVLGLITVGCVLLITVYLVVSGIPAIKEIGLKEFLFGKEWASTAKEPKFGILPFILTSVYGTAGAILIGVPIGFFTAVYLAKLAPKKVKSVVGSMISLLAGIPSVVYGFFGLVVLVPFIRSNIGGTGQSILCASLVLGVMILPTIITLSESALRSVPHSYYEGALALGADHERCVMHVVLPAAASGILASVILAIGRAIGETMAVIMIAGNQVKMPSAITDGVRTMTANIVLEMGYAADLHRGALIGTACVLFVFILIINFAFSALKRKGSNG